jgi:hypothetical protein
MAAQTASKTHIYVFETNYYRYSHCGVGNKELLPVNKILNHVIFSKDRLIPKAA